VEAELRRVAVLNLFASLLPLIRNAKILDAYRATLGGLEDVRFEDGGCWLEQVHFEDNGCGVDRVCSEDGGCGLNGCRL
jgi:hypothetical protein